MGRYLDLARQALEGSAGVLRYEINEKSEKRVPDPYQDLARSALAQICRSRQPVAMVSWLRLNHSALYEELIVRLPDEIHRLWNEHAPLEEFQRILDLWLEAHHTSCEMYQRVPRGGQ